MNAISVVSTAKALAKTFAAMRELGLRDRSLFDAVLRETLAHHPEYLGVWSVWEPNALDGRDRDFVGSPGHDRTGRFIPLWNRQGGIHLEPNLGYDVPGVGDWYQIPLRRRAEAVIDPYPFPFAGRKIFITTQAAPILFRGECVGATGVDIAVDELRRPEASGVEETLHRGFIFLDRNNHVEYWSARTRDLLGGFLGKTLNKMLPASLFNSVVQLRSRDVDADLPALKRGNETLLLRFFRRPQADGRSMIILEQVTCEKADSALSPRQREVLEWLGHGKSNAEIGIILGISIHTVKRHVEHVLAKLGVENRCAAAVFECTGSNKYGNASNSIGLTTY